jgi:uncharacterized protein (TIGR04255 family)
MIPATYNNPPIVEAMVELRFVPSEPWNERLFAAVVEHMRPSYPGQPARRTQVQVQAKVQGEAVEATEGRLSIQQVMLPTLDSRAVVGIGENVLSVHVLAPYPGWGTFLPRVRDAVAAYQEVAHPIGISLLSLRYVDQILLPAGGGDLTDYFTCLPQRPEAMPQTLEGFHAVTQARDTVENFTAVLTLASAPSPPGSLSRLAVLYDLNMVRAFAANPCAVGDMSTHADFLHGRQRQIFEDSITSKTRELFA